MLNGLFPRLIVYYEKNQWEYGDDKQDDNGGGTHLGAPLKWVALSQATFLFVSPNGIGHH